MSQSTEKKLKTREEILEQFRNENLELIAMIIEVEGYEEKLEYATDMDDLPQGLHFILPEFCTYNLTIKYKVPRPMSNMTYHQVVKKGGFIFKQRKEHMAEHAPVNDDSTPYHSVTFPPDKVPGGSLIRGTYPAVSTFLADGEVLLSTNWIIQIVKKEQKPSKGGYA